MTSGEVNSSWPPTTAVSVMETACHTYLIVVDLGDLFWCPDLAIYSNIGF